MKAEQGIEILNSVKMQMNAVEQEKFNTMVLEQVEQFESKVQKCLARLNKKYPNKSKH